MQPQIILASASPRRIALLEQIKVNALVCPVEIDETPRKDELPKVYVQRLAAEKSNTCKAVLSTKLPILAADTTVALRDSIMGKPQNENEAAAMLFRLSGQTHQVYTAVSLRGKRHHQAVSITDVRFKHLTETEIRTYWQSGEPLDKAGGYAIQGLGSCFIESITGSYSGVVGLPLFETAGLLAKEGLYLFHE